MVLRSISWTTWPLLVARFAGWGSSRGPFRETVSCHANHWLCTHVCSTFHCKTIHRILVHWMCIHIFLYRIYRIYIYDIYLYIYIYICISNKLNLYINFRCLVYTNSTLREILNLKENTKLPSHFHPRLKKIRDTWQAPPNGRMLGKWCSWFFFQVGMVSDLWSTPAKKLV